MRNKINWENFTIYLGTVLTVIGAAAMTLAAVTMFTGCSSQKHTEKTSSHQESSMTSMERLDTTAETVSENLAVTTSDMRLHLTAFAIGALPVGPAVANMDVSLTDLCELPDGAGYTAKEGRAGVELRKEGDKITVTGRCDSISRLYRFYRDMSLCELTRNDSLSRELSKTKRTCAEQSEEIDRLRALSETAEKPPSDCRLVFCAGFIPGLIIGYQSKRILNILTQKK